MIGLIAGLASRRVPAGSLYSPCTRPPVSTRRIRVADACPSGKPRLFGGQIPLDDGMTVGPIRTKCRFGLQLLGSGDHLGRGIEPQDRPGRNPRGELPGQRPVAAADIQDALVALEVQLGEQALAPLLLVGRGPLMAPARRIQNSSRIAS